MNDAVVQLGFIGLGTMGYPICRNLLARGHSLVVFDANAEAVKRLVSSGALAAASPQDVANRADTVMVCLPDTDAVRNVAVGTSGIVNGARVRTYVDFSTTGPAVAAEIASRLAERNISAIDSPVTGGIAGAHEGSLTLMVSGPSDAFRAIRPALESISSKIVFVSEIPGQGQMMKLINNILSAAALAITAEAVVLGVKAGLDVDMLLEVVNRSSGRNSATAEKFPRSVLPRKFDAFGRTDIIYKDVCLCLEQAEALGVPMWVGNSVKQLFGFAMSQGGAKQEMTTLVKYLEEWAGVVVRGKDAPSAVEEREGVLDAIVSPVRSK